jgi:hypothetical protein
MKKIIALFLISTLMFVSCKTGDKNGFDVRLTYTNADRWTTNQNAGKADSWVFLEEIAYGKSQLPLIIDSQKLAGSSGNLTFHSKRKDQGIFELVIGENALAIPLINDASEIHVSAFSPMTSSKMP